MQIPRYWAKETYRIKDPRGKEFTFPCWRWSDTSLEEARQWARTSAKEIAWKIINNKALNRYSYGERPLREEILQVLTSANNKEIAMVTRNSYGALVLNTANAMFVDIDFKKEGPLRSLLTIIHKLLGYTALTQEEKYTQSLEQWIQEHPNLGMRIYRTFRGLRCLITSHLFDPTHEQSIKIMENLGSDPLYVNLCRNQNSFRARLSPKPWRCGVDKPPSRYPWETQEDERRYRHWEEEYNLSASKYAVCKLVKQIGDGVLHPEIVPILSVHDRLAGSEYELMLA